MRHHFSSTVKPPDIKALKASSFAIPMAVLVLGICAFLPHAALAQTPKIGQPAPNFTVQSLRGGRTIHLSDFRGHRVLIFAWASW